MEKFEFTYRLEFNEKQQGFHLENEHKDFMAKENTHGWITITDHCTDNEFHILEAYVNRIKKRKLTNEYVLMCLSEVKGFIKNLAEYGLQIKK